MKRLVQATILLAILATLSGCSEHRAQVAVQSALTAGAEALSSADRVVAHGIPEAGDAARAAVAAECPAPCADWSPRYREAMSPWYDATRGLEVAAEALRLAQEGLDIWVDTGALPGGWSALCVDVGESLAALLELLGACGVDVPELLHRAPPVAETACRLASQYAQSAEVTP